MITNEEIKQVFFHCANNDPNSSYADEVDIFEFGKKIESYVLQKQKPMTEDQVVDFMLSVKLGENGDALLDRVKSLVRAVEEFHGIKKGPRRGQEGD